MELNNSEPREVGQNPSCCSSLPNVSAYLESFSPGVLHRGRRENAELLTDFKVKTRNVLQTRVPNSETFKLTHARVYVYKTKTKLYENWNWNTTRTCRCA